MFHHKFDGEASAMVFFILLPATICLALLFVLVVLMELSYNLRDHVSAITLPAWPFKFFNLRQNEQIRL